MSRSSTPVALLAVALLAGCGDDDSPTATALSDMDRLAIATAKYHDVAVALREGFVADPVCVSSPAGAMGIHYVHPGRLDDRIVLEEPEVLLYASEGGQIRLIGVEYLKPVFADGRPHFGPGAPASPGASPTLMGRTFDGPMEGHSPTMPWHWDLHVWVWRHNPAGQFVQFNPEVRCN